MLQQPRACDYGVHACDSSIATEIARAARDYFTRRSNTNRVSIQMAIIFVIEIHSMDCPSIIGMKEAVVDTFFVSHVEEHE